MAAPALASTSLELQRTTSQTKQGEGPHPPFPGNTLTLPSVEFPFAILAALELSQAVAGDVGVQVMQPAAIKAHPQGRASHGLLGSQSCCPHCKSDALGTKTGGALLTPKIINHRTVLKRGVGLLHHFNFINRETEDLCETPRCPQTQGQDFPVCALWLGAAVGLDMPLRLHGCVDQGKGGAPRCASSNSFLPPQNKEGLLIHSTGRSMGWDLQLY